MSEAPNLVHLAAIRSSPRLRAATWLLTVVVAFLPLGLASLRLASFALDRFAGDQRELVTGGTAIVWSVFLTLAVVAVGTAVGLVARRNINLIDVLPYVLAAAAAYLIPLAVRLGAAEGGFDVEWALPQLLIVVGFLAVGAASVAASLTEPAAAMMWRITLRASWGLLLLLALPTVIAVAAGARVPGSIVAIAMVLGYFAVTVTGWYVVRHGDSSRRKAPR